MCACTGVGKKLVVGRGFAPRLARVLGLVGRRRQLANVVVRG